MKRRYFAIPALIGLILLSFIPILRPVLPVIQLPGECYPGAVSMDVIGKIPGFPCWTNTFSSTLLTWFVVGIMALLLNATRRSADSVPSGFYNFFEWMIEGLYGFVEGIVGDQKAKLFFPLFMTWFLIILSANWLGLVPGFDSVGIWENIPHFKAGKEAKVIKSDIKAAYADDAVDEADLIKKLEEKWHTTLEVDSKGVLSSESVDDLIHEIEVKKDKQNLGDLRRGLFLRSATTELDDDGNKPDNADWAIVPFFRPAATDLNFTLAFALLAMGLVQYYGVKFLGLRGYLSKFFPFLSPTFGKEVAENPINAVNVGVGLLEVVGEFSKILSFAFRLLGNIFAGMVLLFVMSTLLPAANAAFFGLEFFVGLIQALVFGLLMLIFINGATISHHGDHHGDDNHGDHAAKDVH